MRMSGQAKNHLLLMQRFNIIQQFLELCRIKRCIDQQGAAVRKHKHAVGRHGCRRFVVECFPGGVAVKGARDVADGNAGLSGGQATDEKERE